VEFATKFVERVRSCLESEQITVPVEIRVSRQGSFQEYRFAAQVSSKAD
jgi:hypothetical protein